MIKNRRIKPEALLAGYYLKHIKLFLIVSLSLLVAACSSVPRYSEIPFIWSSNHRIPPAERIIVIDKTLRQALNKVEQWIEKEGGKIEKINNKYKYAYQTATNAAQLYKREQQILEKEWQAYTDDIKRERAKDELQQLDTLSRGQIQKITSQVDNYEIKVDTSRRFRVSKYGVPDGTRTVMAYNPGVPGIYAGYAYSYQTTKYKTVSENIYFHSRLNIYIFSNDGKTGIYAVGYPVIDKTSVVAGAGKKTTHANWPYVDGSHEAKAIKSLFKFLTTGVYEATDRKRNLKRIMDDYKNGRLSSARRLLTKAEREAKAEREELENEENINKSTNEGLLSLMGAEAFDNEDYPLAVKLLARAKKVSKNGFWENNYPYLVAAYFNTKQIKLAKTLLKNMSSMMKTLKALRGNDKVWFIEAMEKAKSKTAKQYHVLWNKAIKGIK